MEESKDYVDDEYGNWLLKKWDADSLINEGVINLISVPPTLQSVASVSIVTRMWTEPDIIEEFRQNSGYFYDETDNNYCKLEEIVKNKINKALWPNLLKSKVSEFIRPIGIQLLNWNNKRYNEDISLRDFFLMGGSIYWTMEGTIDKVKSLKELIKMESKEKDFCRLYKLACLYCVEECISDLWEKIPFEEKSKFEYIYDRYSIYGYSYTIAYWTLTMRNEWHIMLEWIGTDIMTERKSECSVLQNGIRASIYVGNSFAFKYFWSKLTEHEKNADYIQTWLEVPVREELINFTHSYQKYNPITHILCFLLSHLKDKSKQKEFFRNYSGRFMISLLRSWPHQRYFKPAFLLLVMLDYISENDYDSIMVETAEVVTKQNVTEFFRDVWSVSHQNQKQAFLNNRHFEDVIFSFLEIGDLKTALVVLKDATEDKKNFLLSAVIRRGYMLRYLRSRGDLALLDSLLKEILPPDRNLQSIKQELIHFQCHTCEVMCHYHMCEGDIQKVETFWKWAFQTVKERENFKTKKLRPIEIYVSLICRGNYDHVNHFLNWYFESEEEIYELKNIFFQGQYYLQNLLHNISALKEKSFGLFEKFVRFSLSSPNEIALFKKQCLMEQVGCIVASKRFEFATAILNWCCDDDADKVNQCKTDFVLSHLGLEEKCLLYSIYDSYSMIIALKRSKDFVKWALPLSKRRISALKDFISRGEFCCQDSSELDRFVKRRQRFFRLLDCQNETEFEDILKDC